MEIQEKNIIIDFHDHLNVKKFDEKMPLSYCMKAVDFIVEDEKVVYFIELKDPDHPDAKKKDREKFIEKFQSPQFEEELKYKYRDSFLYEYAAGNLPDKPIIYLIMINAKSLSSAELLAKNDEMKRVLPINLATDEWRTPIASNCIVTNFEKWNEKFTQMQLRFVRN